MLGKEQMRSRTRYNCHKSRQLVSLNYVIAVREEQRHLRGSLAAGNRYNLGMGEALLGDFEKCGMTEQEYRTAKAQLKKWEFATFKVTGRGTIAKLTDTRLFAITRLPTNGQNNTPLTDGQRSANDYQDP
jgi:hypothetical protein